MLAISLSGSQLFHKACHKMRIRTFRLRTPRCQQHELYTTFVLPAFIESNTRKAFCLVRHPTIRLVDGHATQRVFGPSTSGHQIALGCRGGGIVTVVDASTRRPHGVRTRVASSTDRSVASSVFIGGSHASDQNGTPDDERASHVISSGPIDDDHRLPRFPERLLSPGNGGIASHRCRCSQCLRVTTSDE